MDGEIVDLHRDGRLHVNPLTVLKIDVEGAEIDVLGGMEGQLESCRSAFLGYHDEENREVITRFLTSRGFTVTKEYDRPLIRYDRG